MVTDRSSTAMTWPWVLLQVPDFRGGHCVHLLVNLDVAPACVWEPPRSNPRIPHGPDFWLMPKASTVLIP
jgi:hypothetical protein